MSLKMARESGWAVRQLALKAPAVHSQRVALDLRFVSVNVDIDISSLASHPRDRTPDNHR